MIPSSYPVSSFGDFTNLKIYHGHMISMILISPKERDDVCGSFLRAIRKGKVDGSVVTVHSPFIRGH